MQDTRDISPWDILEGVKSNGPLMLSWFGGVRVKRKPLRFEEQRWLLRFHTHQEQFKEMMYRPSFVKLPEAVEVNDVVKLPEEPTPVVDREDIKTVDTKATSQPVPGPQPQPQVMPHNVLQSFPRAPNPRQVLPPTPQGNMIRYPYQQQPGAGVTDNKLILNQIRERALLKSRAVGHQQFNQRPPMYPQQMQQQQRMMQTGIANTYGNNPAAIQRMLMKQHHQRKVLEQQQLQQQQQRAQMAMHAGQYQPGGGYHPGMQPGSGMQPMQANPPVPMHQVMQQPGFNRQAMMSQQAAAAAAQVGNMMVPPGAGNQPGGMQYPPQHPPLPGMNTMHRPMF